MKTDLQSSPYKCHGGQQLLGGKPSAVQFEWPGFQGSQLWTRVKRQLGTSSVPFIHVCLFVCLSVWSCQGLTLALPGWLITHCVDEAGLQLTEILLLSPMFLGLRVCADTAQLFIFFYIPGVCHIGAILMGK